MRRPAQPVHLKPVYHYTVTTKTIKPHILLFLVLSLCAFNQHAQSLDDLVEAADSLHGVDRLEALNAITLQARSEGSKKTFRYAKDGNVLADRLFTAGESEYNEKVLRPVIQANFLLGQQYFERERYISARREFETARLLAEAGALVDEFPELFRHIASVDSLEAAGVFKENFLNKGLNDIGVGRGLAESVDEIEGNRLVKQAERNVAQGDVEKGVAKYRQAIDVFKDLGEAEVVSDLEFRIASLLSASGELEETVSFIDSLIQERTIMEAVQQAGVQEASPEASKQKLLELSTRYKQEEDFEKSLSYFKLYTALTTQMREDSIQTAAQRERRNAEIALLIKQKEIAQLNTEAERAGTGPGANVMDCVGAGSSGPNSDWILPDETATTPHAFHSLP